MNFGIILSVGIKFLMLNFNERFSCRNYRAGILDIGFWGVSEDEIFEF